MIEGLDLQNLDVLEPSCGNGNFVVKLLGTKSLKAQDIDPVALEQMKERCGFEGALEDFLTSSTDEKFDLIIGNPPYIKIQDLPEDTRSFLKSNFESCKTGSVDLYYAFIEQSIKKLRINGILRFIIPNAWMTNASAKRLRRLLINYDVDIVDFGDRIIFDGVGVYTCILTVKNSDKKNTVLINEIEIPKTDDVWAVKPKMSFNFSFKNGLATLCDKAFVFEKKENGRYYSKVKNEFVEIEDEFIRPIIKGSTLEEFWCLYPYNDDGTVKDIGQDTKTWEYLLSIKDTLEDRDYDGEWWLFGRAQGLKHMTGRKLVISSIVSKSGFKFKETDGLVYSGVFVSDNLDEAHRFLRSDEMKKYILKYGKKMANGYASFSKTLLRGIVNG